MLLMLIIAVVVTDVAVVVQGSANQPLINRELLSLLLMAADVCWSLFPV